MTIVEFLYARLDEDERAAHAASPATGGPGRARADVAAKRRIVNEYVRAYQAGVNAIGGRGAPASDDSWGALHAWRKALEHLASAYAGHPDFDHTWAVQQGQGVPRR
ncbi:DUF6221 family protein [Nocardiopsis sp. RSe5-2]|uniref:DUF6221 family protein n=1 Tax=Nocardiopsis endophytica TaxID=3018445 RepID=A0ABT4UBP1_9ACTN|nr:DUF6221 family protein [Nocardiopsis endophytica]MDA2814328.1 DUF6221 family protein [Nocardiopsis endophytica]